MDSTREMPLGVQSKYFAPERGDIGKLKLQFYPKGWEGKDEENMKIGIRNDNTDSLHVHYELSLIDAKGDKYHQEEDAYRIFPQLGRYHSFPRRRLLSLLDSLPTDEFTFHCHVIVLLEGEQEIAPSCTTTTHFDFALFTFHYVPFTWTIEQLNRQLHKHTIESRIFSPSSDSRYTFNLRIYPKKDSENVILALYFIWTNSIEESTVDWKYSVVDTKGNDWYVKGSTGFSIPKRVESSPQEVIPYRTLDNFASILLPEGTLTIKCELWIHEPRKKLPPELLN